MNISTGATILGVALLLIVAIMLIAPLLDKKTVWLAPPSAAERLQIERDSVLRTIRELDEDHRTQKISDEDYRNLRIAQINRGAEILKQLDAMNTQVSDDPKLAAIEEAIARARKSHSTKTSAQHCASCNAIIKADAKFCPQCGAKLT